MSEHGDEISPEIAAQLDRFSKGDLQQLLDGHQQWIGIHQQEMEGLERRIEAHQRFVDNLSRRLRGHPPNSRHFRQPGMFESFSLATIPRAHYDRKRKLVYQASKDSIIEVAS